MRWNKISNQNLSVEQFLAQKRNELVIFQQKTSEISIKIVDELSTQIIQLSQMLQTKDVEIKRLQELCEKNKINHKPVEKSAPKETPVAKWKTLAAQPC